MTAEGREILLDQHFQSFCYKYTEKKNSPQESGSQENGLGPLYPWKRIEVRQKQNETKLKH